MLDGSHCGDAGDTPDVRAVPLSREEEPHPGTSQSPLHLETPPLKVRRHSCHCGDMEYHEISGPNKEVL